MATGEISRVMTKAQRADRPALFAGFQAAVVLLIDWKHGMPFPEEAFRDVERAIEIGQPSGWTVPPAWPR
jgi:hypothetical protein